MNPWLIAAIAYLAGGWLTLACCSYACAKDVRSYRVGDFILKRRRAKK